LNDRLTLEQDNILERALSIYPEQRYPSILAFAETLQQTVKKPTITTATTALAERNGHADTSPIIHTEPLSDGAPQSTQPLIIAALATADPGVAVSVPEQTTLAEAKPVVAEQTETTDSGETSPDAPARFIITSPYAQQPREVRLEQEEITLGRA